MSLSRRGTWCKRLRGVRGMSQQKPATAVARAASSSPAIQMKPKMLEFQPRSSETTQSIPAKEAVTRYARNQAAPSFCSRKPRSGRGSSSWACASRISRRESPSQTTR
ncbi:hypothetical protein D3C86_1768790 [compost metagenome]